MEHWAGYNRTDGALGRLDDGSHGLTGPGLLTARCSCPGPGPARGDLAEIISRTFPASSRWPATTRCWPPTTRSREELLAARPALSSPAAAKSCWRRGWPRIARVCAGKLAAPPGGDRTFRCIS